MKKIIIVAAVLLALAGAAAFAARDSLSLRFFPDRYLTSALLNTALTMNREARKLPDPFIITEGVHELSLSLGLNGYDLPAAVIPENYITAMEAAKLITLNINSRADIKNRVRANKIGVYSGGIALTEFDVFLSGDLLAVKNETLFDRAVTVNPKTFMSDWNLSPALPAVTGVYMPQGYGIEEIIDSILLSEWIAADAFDGLDSDKSFMEILTPLDIEYKGKGTEESQDYDVFTASYSADDLNPFADTYLRAFSTVMNDYFTEKIPVNYRQTEIYRDFKGYADRIEGFEFTEDAAVTFRVDSEKIIRIIEADFPDGKISCTDNSSDGSLRRGFSADFDFETERFMFDCGVSWVRGSDDFNVSLTVLSGGYKVELSAEGALSSAGDGILFKDGIVSLAVTEDGVSSRISFKTGFSLKTLDEDVRFEAESESVSLFDINLLQLAGIALKAGSLFEVFSP